MNNILEKYISFSILDYLSDGEKSYLNQVFIKYNGYPSLEDLWALMDEPWIKLCCDPQMMDERITKYYQHPVWLLNGLFIEQDSQSIDNRCIFTNWVVSHSPGRIADFGGGFGSLARMIGSALPDTVVEVVDPHPHKAAISLAESTPNVRFVPDLNGEYDLLIATDVFEHVLDPIGLTAITANHLKRGGVYLIANCFKPAIKCHLPQLFHLNISWDKVMKTMGLEPEEKVGYGRAYRRVVTEYNLDKARKVDECSKSLFPLVKYLPLGQAEAGKLLVSLLCRKV